MGPKGVPAPRSPLWRRAASSPLCFKRWYLRRNTHPPASALGAPGSSSRPCPSPRRWRQTWRTRIVSAGTPSCSTVQRGGSLARIMQVFCGTFAPPVSAFIPRSFPSCGICPPAVVIAPRVETSDPGQRCRPFPSLDIPGKGAPGPPRGPCRPMLGVGFRHPHPPFWPKNGLFGG